MRVNRNPLFSALMGAALSLFSLSALALPEDSRQPINISADSASINDKTGVTVYSGDVEITQGSMTILGARVELHRNKAGDIDRIVSTGSPARFSQQPIKSEPMTHAYGQRMEYQISRQRISIENNARVEQGKDEFTGQRIVYNMKDAVVNAYGSKSGDTRVKMVIQPRSTGN